MNANQLVELKGRAVRYMNEHPVLKLRGAALPINFVVEIANYAGRPCLRLGASVFVLCIDAFPGGIGPTWTGRSGFIVVDVTPSPEDFRRARQAFGIEGPRVCVVGLSVDADEVVQMAAQAAAGREFIRAAIEGALPLAESATDSSRRFAQEDRYDSKSECVELPWYDDYQPRPPSVQLARELGAIVAELSNSSERRAVWDETVIRTSWFEGRPTLLIDGSIEVVYLPEVPRSTLEPPEHDDPIVGLSPGVGIVQHSMNPLESALAAAMPEIGLRTWTPLAVHRGWRPAIVAALGHAYGIALDRRILGPLRARLKEGDPPNHSDPDRADKDAHQ